MGSKLYILSSLKIVSEYPTIFSYVFVPTASPQCNERAPPQWREKGAPLFIEVSTSSHTWYTHHCQVERRGSQAPLDSRDYPLIIVDHDDLRRRACKFFKVTRMAAKWVWSLDRRDTSQLEYNFTAKDLKNWFWSTYVLRKILSCTVEKRRRVHSDFLGPWQDRVLFLDVHAKFHSQQIKPKLLKAY